MNRRDFLQCAALLAAGSGVLPAGWALSAEQSAFLSARPSYIDSAELTLFTEAQRAAVIAAAEHIIPETDSPGATAAGVPRFIELMVADWFDDDERAHFMRGLDELLASAGGDFAGLDAAQQLAQLEALEEAAGDSPWFDLGNVTRVWISDAPFICQFKELVVLGYFLSEVGATQALRINPMGSFNGQLALTEQDRSYASQLPIRMIARD